MITYHSPLVEYATEKAFTLSFTLGTDMSVDTIIGLSFLRQMQLELRFDPEVYLSHVMRKEFEVIYNETKLSVISKPIALKMKESKTGSKGSIPVFNNERRQSSMQGDNTSI